VALESLRCFRQQLRAQPAHRMPDPVQAIDDDGASPIELLVDGLHGVLAGRRGRFRFMLHQPATGKLQTVVALGQSGDHAIEVAQAEQRRKIARAIAAGVEVRSFPIFGKEAIARDRPQQAIQVQSSLPPGRAGRLARKSGKRGP
jgi:hypothetical protein